MGHADELSWQQWCLRIAVIDNFSLLVHDQVGPDESHATQLHFGEQGIDFVYRKR